MEVLRRSVRTAAAVPADARDIMIRAGVDPELLDPDTIDDARVQIAGAIVGAEQVPGSATISTRQAAAMLQTADSNVRRSIASNRIYSAGRLGPGHQLPQWQFVGGKPLPHLAEVLVALPTDLHPIEVESFFTSPDETLNGMSPADWLATGGSLQPVIALAEAESWR